LDGDRKPKPLLVQPQSQFNAVFSPDGRWLAYASNELEFTGRPEIFVQPYPLTGAKYKITTDGGGDPLWSPDGKELFYSWDSKLFAVEVRTQPAFSFGKPSPLQIDGIMQRGLPRSYDITPDGKQFLVVLPASQAGTNSQPLQINVVLNWLEELKQ